MSSVHRQDHTEKVESYFLGRELEKNRIKKALARGKNVVVTGKYGIGRTSLIKRFAELNGKTWRFLFADFSLPPARICNHLLAGLRPKKPSKGPTRHVDYRQSRALITRLASKHECRCVAVLDNVAKLTAQKLRLVRSLAPENGFLFIAIAERFLPDDDLFHLRACLYPSELVRMRNLSAGQTAKFFRQCAIRYQFQWTERDIHTFTLATKGYPLAMRETVERELQRQERT